MNLSPRTFWFTFFTMLWLATATAVAQRLRPFDADWRFLKSDARDAEQAAFDDSTWRQLNVPHDWSIEGPFDPDAPAGQAGAYLNGGIGWYRKHFTLSDDDSTKRVFVEFDGVMANSDVWINGFHLGHRPYGYVSFRYDLTGHLNFGRNKSNVLAVRVDNANQPASRWYSGAGIYRHVRLVTSNPVHLERWATFVTTPAVARDGATIRVRTTIVNQSEAAKPLTVMATISGPAGSAPDGSYACFAESPPQTVPAGKAVDVTVDVTMPWPPRLWDPDHPDLHHARVRVLSAGQAIDEEVVPFGIRQIEFRADTGFWINGKNMKLLGVCLHHDGGAFGAAVPLGVWERRLKALQELGVNAIRTAHNPPAPEFLDLCDRMGFLVMDETFDCWTVAKTKYDYHLYFKEWSQIDTRDTVIRDRNHPCIVIWSAGNEIHDLFQPGNLMFDLFTPLRDTFHQNDPTRPVTMAVLRPNVAHVYDNGFAELMDVVGQNYRENELVAAHDAKPSRKVIGTENGHPRDVWLALRDHPFYSGQFLWSGCDYLGESHGWPNVFNSSGLLDHTGTAKPMAYERQSWWSSKPMVRIVRVEAPIVRSTTGATTVLAYMRRPRISSDWTPRDASNGAVQNVQVFSNAEQVELFLNDKSLGVQSLPKNASPRAWQIPFEPGTLKAVAKNKDQVVATDELRTAGKAARIELSCDRKSLKNDWDDVAYVEATIVDENGVRVPAADDQIRFTISAGGAVAAVDSGDTASHEPFQASQRRAYNGTCVAILKATDKTGPITLTATSPGLHEATITLEKE